jgi:hypothetical protein
VPEVPSRSRWPLEATRMLLERHPAGQRLVRLRGDSLQRPGARRHGMLAGTTGDRTSAHARRSAADGTADRTKGMTTAASAERRLDPETAERRTSSAAPAPAETQHATALAEMHAFAMSEHHGRKTTDRLVTAGTLPKRPSRAV